MPTAGNFNMEDPTKQEQIRRGHHRYEPSAGRHGSYVPAQYDRAKNEYPKMMGEWPKPQLKDFLTANGVAMLRHTAEENLQTAILEWDRAMTASIVNSPAEEARWKKEFGSKS